MDCNFPDWMLVVLHPVNCFFLGFLCSELLVARKCGAKSSSISKSNGLHTNDMMDYLKRACLALKIPPPTKETDTGQIFSTLHKAVSVFQIFLAIHYKIQHFCNVDYITLED